MVINLLWLSHKDTTGGFVYTQNLLDRLFTIDSTNNYFLILKLRDYCYFKKRYGAFKNVSFKIIDIRSDVLLNPFRALKKLLAKITGGDGKIESIIRNELQCFLVQNKIDVFFCPSVPLSPKELRGVKIITTIYDLQHEYFPQNFSGGQLSFRKKEYRRAAEESGHIIAISEFTRQSIIEKYNINPEKVTAIPLAAMTLPRAQCAIKLPQKFIFYPAAFWPHKNHATLIHSLERLKSEFPGLHIVFTGASKKKSVQEGIKQLVQRYKLEKVHFAGFVSDAELGCIYDNAALMVFPSSFEGFGMPIMEAFGRGVPVIAANNSSLTEITEGAGLLFETGSVEELCEHIKNVLLHKNLREKLIQRGRERARQFSWEKTAQKTLTIFNSP